MAASKDDDKNIIADIPQSVFEEALKAVEDLEQQKKTAKAKKKPKRSKAAQSSVIELDIEDSADDLDSLLNLLDSQTKESEPKTSSANGDEDLEMLSQFLKDERSLEKKAEQIQKTTMDSAQLKASEKKLEAATAKAAEKDELIKELNERLMRLQAEFENFRKRKIKDAQDAKKYHNEQLILQILPIIDNFERAIEHMQTQGDKESMFEGIQLIYRQIMTVLENGGVRMIDTSGEKFNPLFHEAMATANVEGTDAGSILAEYQTGYLLNDRLLRPSKVLVAAAENGKTKPDGAQEGKEEQPNDSESKES